MPQLDCCVPACNHELETLALLSYFLGVYRNSLEYENFPIFSHWCQQRKHRRVCTMAKTWLPFVALKCDKHHLPDFFSSLMRAAKAQGLASQLSWAFVVLKCDIYMCLVSRIFLSRFNASSESSGWAVHGISSTEPSLLENTITVHCGIFQIKHWNINKRVPVIRTYFLKMVVIGKTQSEHLFRACTACRIQR